KSRSAHLKSHKSKKKTKKRLWFVAEAAAVLGGAIAEKTGRSEEEGAVCRRRLSQEQHAGDRVRDNTVKDKEEGGSVTKKMCMLPAEFSLVLAVFGVRGDLPADFFRRQNWRQ
ncbi:hypothetical protein PIB30_079242, partial [Stylosanthes scabra]|nr:hypothetical protein [Stylosanthes scabra]